MNSVTRLHDILKAIWTSPKEHTLKQVLLKYFQLGSERDPKYNSYMAKYFSLPANAEKLIRTLAYRFDVDSHLTWVAPVNDFYFNSSLGDTVGKARNRIQKHVIDNLAVIYQVIERDIPGQNIQEEEIKDIRETLIDVIQKASNASDIPENCKKYIVEQCLKLLDGLFDYQFFGDEVFRSGLESTVGSVVTQPDEVKQSKDSEIGKQFWSVVARISQLVSLVNNVPKLPCFDKLIETLKDQL